MTETMRTLKRVFEKYFLESNSLSLRELYTRYDIAEAQNIEKYIAAKKNK